MSSQVSTHEAQELRRLIPLNTLSAGRFEQLCAEIKIEDGPKGGALFRQGDPTTEFVYVLSGTVSLQAGGVEMDSVVGGSETSRFALAHQNPRKVSAIAKDRIRYVRISTDIANQRDESPAQAPAYMVSHSPETSGDDWISALLRSPVFRRLPPSNLQALLRTVEEIECKKGDVICQQDDEGDYFYIIKQGKCALTRKPSQFAKEIKLATLKDFDTFGEDALISEKPRTVTVTMSTDGVLLRLDKANFLRLVGNAVISLLDAEEAMALMKRDGTWLDLRLPDVYQLSHPHGAINTPFFSLRMMLPSLERHKKYVLVCEDGKLSAAGAYLLLRHGFEAYALRGGIDTLPPEAIGTAKPQPASLSITAERAMDSEPAATGDIEIEITGWEPPATGLEPYPDFEAMSTPLAATPEPASAEPGEEARKLKDRLARAERELSHLETERGQLARDKEAAATELERARQSLQRQESRIQSLLHDHEAAQKALDEAKSSGGADQALKRELEELKAAHSETLFEKETAEQEIDGLQKQLGELKTLVEELIDQGGGEYQPDEEADALRSELEMVRERASAELTALQARLAEVDAENAKLRTETQTLKTQLSIREVAATVAVRESASDKRDMVPSGLLWPLLGLLLAALILGGLLGLEPGRELLRTLLGN